jgi:hypothetical protein
VSDFNITQIIANKEFVVPNHSSKPLIIGPTTKSGNGINGANVKKEEEDSSTRSRVRFVVRGDLLWADSLKEGLHVVEV